MNAPRIPGESIAAATQVSGVIVDRDDRAAPVRNDYGRAHADGELGAGLSMLDHATRALSMALFHVERAIAQGSGQSPDLVQLATLSRELAGIAPRVEAATTKLTAKVGA